MIPTSPATGPQPAKSRLVRAISWVSRQIFISTMVLLMAVWVDSGIRIAYAWHDPTISMTRALGNSLYCQLTGCTMTGQVVFSGVTTDITTGTNESLRIVPNGSGITNIESDSLGFVSMRVKSNTLTRPSTIGFVQQSDDGSALVIGWGNNMGAPQTQNSYFQSSIGRMVFLPGGAATEVVGITSTGIAGPADNVINGGDIGLADGTRLLSTITSLVAGDCDSDAEVTREVKYSKTAGATISKCICQKTGSVYSWVSAGIGGDCT